MATTLERLDAIARRDGVVLASGPGIRLIERHLNVSTGQAVAILAGKDVVNAVPDIRWGCV